MFQEFTKQHAAYIENLQYTITQTHKHFDLWRCVGRIEQSYKEQTYVQNRRMDFEKCTDRVVAF